MKFNFEINGNLKTDFKSKFERGINRRERETENNGTQK